MCASCDSEQWLQAVTASSDRQPRVQAATASSDWRHWLQAVTASSERQPRAQAAAASSDCRHRLRAVLIWRWDIIVLRMLMPSPQGQSEKREVILHAAGERLQIYYNMMYYTILHYYVISYYMILWYILVYYIGEQLIFTQFLCHPEMQRIVTWVVQNMSGTS